MSDRSSAYLFAQFFEYLSKLPGHGPGPDGMPDPAVMNFWYQTFDYDFHPSQMCCDDVLKKLGLARDTIDRYEEEVVQYREPDGSYLEDF